MGNTKRVILEAALELFSVQGCEATSIAQIADAVGVRKSSLYSHFDGKQAILDAPVQEALEQYDRHSMYARAHWDEDDAARLDLTPDGCAPYAHRAEPAGAPVTFRLIDDPQSSGHMTVIRKAGSRCVNADTMQAVDAFLGACIPEAAPQEDI